MYIFYTFLHVFLLYFVVYWRDNFIFISFYVLTKYLQFL